jgi:hypothetical protein
VVILAARRGKVMESLAKTVVFYGPLIYAGKEKIN